MSSDPATNLGGSLGRCPRGAESENHPKSSTVRRLDREPFRSRSAHYLVRSRTMPSTQSSRSAHGRVSAAFTLVAVFFLSATILNAQARIPQDSPTTIPRALFDTPTSETRPTPPSTWKSAVGPVSAGGNAPYNGWGRSQSETDRGTFAATNRQQPAFPRRTSTKRTSGQRKALGAVLGVAGGFFVGGFVGAALDRNCHCDDPGLQGFIVGAPIGAAGGGVLGFIIGSR